MKELYEKSLQMIKELKIERENEYNELLKKHLILNIESLKYISQKRDFTEIGFFFFYKFHKVAQMQQDT